MVLEENYLSLVRFPQQHLVDCVSRILIHFISILLQDEYLKAYYAAIMEQQKLAAKLNEQESAGESTTTDIESATTYSDRQVGMKSKREEEEEDVEWEEGASVAANGNYKVDLNVEAEEAEEKEDGDEDDDIDWEEG
jgi:transcription initiation factor TFIIE subunit alpha